MTPATWVAFGVAAAVGAPARYLVDRAVTGRTRGAFPYGTLTVNVVGSLVLGFVAGLALYHGLSSAPKTVIGTGLCGAFTTFSAFSFETVRLIETGENGAAARNVAATALGCGAAAALGLVIASL